MGEEEVNDAVNVYVIFIRLIENLWLKFGHFSEVRFFPSNKQLMSNF